MKKIMWITTFTIAMVIGAGAALITNGDWESTLNPNWVSSNSGDTQADLSGWYSSKKDQNADGAYIEPITGYGDNMVGALKAFSGNYFQQALAGVNAGSINEYTINYDGGIRFHSSYPSDARDITLRVSLWDTTVNVELAGVDIVTAFSSSATSLEARSHVLTYNNAGLDGHQIAVRFENTTDTGTIRESANTVLFDNITVIPEPATFGLVVAFGGGLVLVRRKKLLM